MAITLAIALRKREPHVECGPGFLARSPRCLGCPPPLMVQGGNCRAPDVRVHVPETTLTVGPSDWEAEGRVAARSVHVAPFMIDAFEATSGDFDPASKDGARAAGNLIRDEAVAYCASRGGRLPTEDEWLAAAAAAMGGGEATRFRRYPWGDTGAVCRRAAWGLEVGPCAHGAQGPDTVGAHPDGDTPNGIHDLAGNVAEWVAAPSEAAPDLGVVRGGSYRSALATELRTWSRREIPVTAREPDVGVRCAYDGR